MQQLLCVLLLSSSLTWARQPPPGVTVTQMNIVSEIQARFAITDVLAEMENTGSRDQAVNFTVTLPERAFISQFNMDINGKIINGQVKERDIAAREFKEAQWQDWNAGLVEQRDESTFVISTNLAANSIIRFNVTYQEVLKRQHGVYRHSINVKPDYDVSIIEIDVLIAERERIRKIHIPKFSRNNARMTNKQLLNQPEDASVEVRSMSQSSGSLAYIYYDEGGAWGAQPDGQMTILYDVERDFNGGNIETLDGYFVHFIAPDGVDPGAKDIVFVIDTSGSMKGLKMQQVKSAMDRILDDLSADDYFNIVTFDSAVSTWLDRPVVASASNKVKAKQYVNGVEAVGGTNIDEAVQRGMRELRNTAGRRRPLASIILLLTDGQATHGETDQNTITRNARNANTAGNTVMHSIAFGGSADYQLMKDLAMDNEGVARKIYEDHDAGVQLEGFYEEIATPLLGNVNIEYIDGAAQVGSLVQLDSGANVLNDGGEMIVLGQTSNSIRPHSEMRATVMADTTAGTRQEFQATNFKRGRPVGDCFDKPQPLTIRGRTFDQFANVPTPAHIKLCETSRRSGPIRRRLARQLAANTISGFIERMWAYATISKYLDESDSRRLSTAERSRLRRKATDLSLKYGLVTPVTSMIIVDRETRAGQTRANDLFQNTHHTQSAVRPPIDDFATPRPNTILGDKLQISCKDEHITFVLDRAFGDTTRLGEASRLSTAAILMRDIVKQVRRQPNGAGVKFSIATLDRSKNVNLAYGYEKSQSTADVLQAIDDVIQGKESTTKSSYSWLWRQMSRAKGSTQRLLYLTDGSSSPARMSSRLVSLRTRYNVTSAVVAIHGQDFTKEIRKELVTMVGSQGQSSSGDHVRIVHGDDSMDKIDRFLSC